jgi:hypothetical protein
MMRLPHALFLAFVLCLSAGLALPSNAAAQSIALDLPECLPSGGNGAVRATAQGLGPGQSARLYFRWTRSSDFYWLPLEIEPGARFWAVLPKPEGRNHEVEVYAALVDPSGAVVARTADDSVPVRGDCGLRLSPKEKGAAESLVIGETVASQKGKRIFAFECDGVVTRIDPAGVRRADEVCRACVVAWWQKKEVLIPVVAAGLVGILVEDGEEREPSPSRP